ncbi:hypothetical protein SM124_14090 [Bacillus sp. 31A1R]|uniref:Uncharacterized protein n=1 Tax=Robertmurraya mangrovi TaxID=3098077 RepID=A0ABU5J0B3_9BACI|nr:hypothetical protein [Bacillus sp. 31A1R]MDZ5472859.1 hypothetical protein [Bacillus sp. 31A1R]
MKNKTIPFMVLAILHIILFFYTFYKNKQKTLAVLFFGIGLSYVFEYFVLNLFKMYTYYPKVSKNRWIDSVFGAVLSQSVFVPIAGTFLVLFNLSWKWKMGFTLFYGIVEQLFIRWKVFRNNWWKTAYTITAMPIFFYLVKKWWVSIQNGGKLNKNFALFLFYWVNYTNILFLPLALFRKYFFHIGFLKDRYWEHFVLIPIYTFVTSVGATINTFVSNRKKPIVLLLLHLFDQLLFKLKIIQPNNKIYLYMLMPVHLLVLYMGVLYRRLMANI